MAGRAGHTYFGTSALIGHPLLQFRKGKRWDYFDLNTLIFGLRGFGSWGCKRDLNFGFRSGRGRLGNWWSDGGGSAATGAEARFDCGRFTWPKRRSSTLALTP
jgi:hypothetical protein